MMDMFIELCSILYESGSCFYSALMNCNFFLFSHFESSEFSQPKVEGFHQEGQKSAQTGPDQQLQTNDFASVS